MRFEKSVTINLGNYESLKIGVDDCESFDICDSVIFSEIKRLDLCDKIDLSIKKSLNLK